MNDDRNYRAEFRDPELQGQILLTLFLENHPLAFREIADLVMVEPTVVAGNCGELRAKGWIAPVVVDGTTGMELTVQGTEAVRRMFPSA